MSDSVSGELGAKTSEKHVHKKYTPLTPLLCRKTGVCRDTHIFLYFDPKHWISSVPFHVILFRSVRSVPNKLIPCLNGLVSFGGFKSEEQQLRVYELLSINFH